ERLVELDDLGAGWRRAALGVPDASDHLTVDNEATLPLEGTTRAVDERASIEDPRVPRRHLLGSGYCGRATETGGEGDKHRVRRHFPYHEWTAL
ncbi:MAG TPA: hypothetical protein VEK15_21970, partial [Vicinamibacteria bacterium]|nr:hypothetical protein [Vicinamibacteria bacterium]